MGHLFGPVPSRRLGRSLGVDLIPPKTCPYHCIYCEVGPTTCQTGERFSYQTEAIIEEMADYLKDPGVRPDVITLAGSGEPTLNQGLGRIIREIKAMSQIPVAVLTNGALLYLPEVRRELAAADIVLPSLDAAREETYRAINRPLPELSLASSAGRPHGLPPGVPGPALARSHAAQRIKRHRRGIIPLAPGPTKNRPGPDPAQHRGAAGGGSRRGAPGCRVRWRPPPLTWAGR